ncbi:MAG TPA: hypothetical protein ACFYEH_06365 [Candidatus Brocadiaceae bacterium]
MSKVVKSIGGLGIGLSFFGYLLGYLYYKEVLKQLFNINIPATYYFSWDFILVRGIEITSQFILPYVLLALIVYYLVSLLLDVKKYFEIARWLYYISLVLIIALNFFGNISYWYNYSNIMIRLASILSLLFLYALITLATRGNHDYMKEVGSSVFAISLIMAIVFFFSFLSVSLGKYHAATAKDKNGYYDYPKVTVEYKNTTKRARTPKDYYFFSKTNDCLYLFEKDDLHLRCLPLGEVSSWYPVSKEHH